MYFNYTRIFIANYEVVTLLATFDDKITSKISANFALSLKRITMEESDTRSRRSCARAYLSKDGDVFNIEFPQMWGGISIRSELFAGGDEMIKVGYARYLPSTRSTPSYFFHPNFLPRLRLEFAPAWLRSKAGRGEREKLIRAANTFWVYMSNSILKKYAHLHLSMEICYSSTRSRSSYSSVVSITLLSTINNGSCLRFK